MNSPLPIEGKAFRFAPARGQRPASTFWKIWVEGAEVYLVSRGPAGIQHISVHQSGAIHYRLGAKQKQDLAPLMRLASGYWQHAVELRFLLSDGSLPPAGELKSLKNKKAHILPVPEGFVLHVNLLIGDAPTNVDVKLPSEFLPAASLLWRAPLRDGRTAALIGRQLPLSAENEKQIHYIRQELKPTVTLSKNGSGEKRVEVQHMHWSQTGGNVILVVPMGTEAFRFDDEPVNPEESGTIRTFSMVAPGAENFITAPDGRQVVAIRIEGINSRLELCKGKPIDVVLGHLHLELLTDNLIAGSRFASVPIKLAHDITIGGASPKSWAYSVAARFDNTAMTVEVLQLSTGIRNTSSVVPVEGMAENEELTLTAPTDTQRYVLTLPEIRKSEPLIGKVCLRNQK